MEKCFYQVRSKIKKEQLQDIIDVFKIFSTKNIPVFARDGMLLGTIRHKGFLPFDIDPDVGILSDHYSQLWTNLEGYEVIIFPTKRNIRYYNNTGYPYEFSIHKKNPYKGYILWFLFILMLFFAYKKNILALTILFILQIVCLYISGPKILDGTIYPSKNGVYYQEVEKGEQHVFKDHYGHKDNEKHFTFTKKDVLPLKKAPFYHGDILVPNQAEKILLEHYGKDVFNVMYKKEDKNMVKIDISDCDPPPAEVV